MKQIRTILAVGALAAAPFAQDNLATWGKSKPITINTSATGVAISDTLYGFPLLVRLDSTHAEVFDQAKAGGADLRFRQIPGRSLPYYIDNWDSAGRKAEIWVAVDAIYPDSATQAVHMLWQKADAPAASNAGAVFAATNGFAAAWHMGGAPGNRANSTPGGPPAVPATMVPEGTFSGRTSVGVVGAADSLLGGTFAEGGEYFDVSPMPSFEHGFTITMWTYVTSTANRPWMRYFDFANGVGDNYFAGREASTSNIVFDVFGSRASSSDVLVAGQWQHLAITVGAGSWEVASPMIMYVNGAQTGVSESFDVLGMAAERYASYLGRSHWEDAFFTGKMDEVHVSNVARPAGWAKLSYETQKPGASVLAFGATGAPVSVARAAESASRRLAIAPQGRGYLFALPAAADADLRVTVLDLHGRAVWNGAAPKGATTFSWNGLTAAGQPLTRGMYFVRMAPAAGARGPVWESRFAHTR